MHDRLLISSTRLLDIALVVSLIANTVSCVSSETRTVDRSIDPRSSRAPKFELVDEKRRTVAEIWWSDVESAPSYIAEGHLLPGTGHKLFMTLGHAEGRPVEAFLKIEQGKNKSNGSTRLTALNLHGEQAWFEWTSEGTSKLARVYLDASGSLRVDER